MRQHQPKWRILIGMLIGISTVIALAIYKILGVVTWNGVWVGLTKISIVGFATWGLWEWFRRHLWRVKIFQGWLVDIPNISGQWEGELKSSYVDEETGDPTPDMPVTCNIRQRFNTVHIKFQVNAGSSKSYSVVASFVTDEEAGRKKLVYSFENESDPLDDGLDNHFGTAVLEIEGSPPNRMAGFYLNNRRNQSKGKLTLRKTQS